MRLNCKSGALVLALGSAVGCTAYPTIKPAGADCSIASNYDFLAIDPFETAGMSPFWTASDAPDSGTAVIADTVDALTNGARCKSMDALMIRSFHNNDWGSLLGYNNFGPRDASAYERMS